MCNILKRVVAPGTWLDYLWWMHSLDTVAATPPSGWVAAILRDYDYWYAAGNAWPYTDCCPMVRDSGSPGGHIDRFTGRPVIGTESHNFVFEANLSTDAATRFRISYLLSSVTWSVGIPTQWAIQINVGEQYRVGGSIYQRSNIFNPFYTYTYSFSDPQHWFPCIEEVEVSLDYTTWAGSVSWQDGPVGGPFVGGIGINPYHTSCWDTYLSPGIFTIWHSVWSTGGVRALDGTGNRPANNASSPALHFPCS